MKFLQVLSPALITLTLSAVKVHSAQVAVYELESTGGEEMLYHVVGVVCDDSVDFSSVDLDALCGMPNQGLATCVVDACGTSYNGTATGFDSDGCNSAKRVTAGSIGDYDYPGSSECQEYSTCTSGPQGGVHHNGFICKI